MTPLSRNNILTNSYKRLSVQVSLTGLSFLVSHEDTKDTIFFTEKILDRNYTPEELLFEIQHQVAREPAMTGPFTEVNVIYATNMYAVVPLPLFDEGKASEYLKFNAKILANDFIAHDKLSNHDAVVVYVPFVNINNFFFEQYGAFQYYHSTTLLLNSLLDTARHGVEPKIFLHVRQGQFDLVIVKDAALILCNTYSYKTPEDFIYYVLFSLEQLNLNPDSIETTLMGAIDKHDEIYEIVYRYIRNVSFTTAAFSGIRFAENTAAHHHYILKHSL